MWTTFLSGWIKPTPTSSPSDPFTTHKIHPPLAPPRGPLQEAQVVFSPRDEERSGAGDLRQSCEVHIRAVEQVERTGFENERIQPQHVVGTRRAHFDLYGNRTTQVELRVQLDARFGRAELGPRKKLQGQVDGRRTDRREIA
jgi:hypothetical protein